MVFEKLTEMASNATKTVTSQASLLMNPMKKQVQDELALNPEKPCTEVCEGKDKSVCMQNCNEQKAVLEQTTKFKKALQQQS